MSDPKLADLEAKGRALLRDPRAFPNSAPIGNRQFILQLWHHPSFDSWSSWTVYSPWHGMTTTALVRRAIWDCHRDRVAVNHPQRIAVRSASFKPTVYVTDATMEWKAVREWLGRLAEIRVPLIHTHKLGTDGETRGLRCGDDFLAMEFQWWGDGPHEWKDLLKFYERARDACEDRFV
jgi:hypothetical protein